MQLKPGREIKTLKLSRNYWSKIRVEIIGVK